MPNAAIIFDFDGVIVHSEGAHMLTIRELAATRGVTFTDDTYFREYVALSDRDIFPRLWKDNGRELTTAQLKEIILLKQARYEQMVDGGHVVAFPGSIDLIRACAAKLPVAICSAASRATIEASIHALDIARCFQTIVSADDVARSKPDPAPYALAAKRLGFEPGLCVAIEDTVGGMTSALHAGCKVAAVCHTVPRERLTAATLVVDGTIDLTVERLLNL